MCVFLLIIGRADNRSDVHVVINCKVIFFMCTPSLSPLNVVLLVIMMAVTCMNIRGNDDHRLIGSTWFPVDFDTTIDIFFYHV